MKSSISLDQLPTKLSRFIHRYHIVVFVILVIGSMIVVMLMLNSTIQSSTDTDTLNVAQPPSRFDTETIEKLESLKVDSDSGDQLQFPSGRVNPFVE